MSSMTVFPAAYAVGPRPALRGQVRLTRRGRLVVFLTSLALVLGAALWLAAGSMATDEAGTPQATEVVQVGSGDTLWTIASERAEAGEVRSMMYEIRELNALDDSMLLAGQDLHVPVDD